MKSAVNADNCQYVRETRPRRGRKIRRDRNPVLKEIKASRQKPSRLKSPFVSSRVLVFVDLLRKHINLTSWGQKF